MAGHPVLSRADRILYLEIAQELREHYEATGEQNLKKTDTRLKPRKQYFREYRALGIVLEPVTPYIRSHQKNKGSNSTINRELAMLTKMFRFVYEGG